MGFRKTFTEGFGAAGVVRGLSVDGNSKPENLFRASMNSFFKGARKTESAK
jgi:hypothetical protein